MITSMLIIIIITTSIVTIYDYHSRAYISDSI